MKNLISRIYERIKTPVLTGATAATLAVMPYISGCEDPNFNRGMAILGAGTQASPYSTFNQRTAGAMIGTAGQLGYQKNVAETGRSEVNVNVYNANQNSSTLKEGKIINTEFGGLAKINENGKIIEWINAPSNSFYIYDVNDQGEFVPGLDYDAYIKAHPERYKKGWKIENVVIDNKLQEGKVSSVNYPR